MSRSPYGDRPNGQKPLRLRAAVAAGWSLSQNAARELFAFLTFVVLARWFLDESDFGIVALANGFIAFAGLLVRNGFIAALIQRPEIDDRHRTAAFWTIMFLSVAASFLVSALAWPLAAVTDEPRLPHVLEALAWSLLPLSAGTVHEAELRRRLEFRAMTMRALVAAVLGSLAAIAAAVAGAGVWSLVVQAWVTAAASSAMLWLLLPWRPALKLPLREARELLPMGTSVTGLAVLNFSNRFVDRLIISIVLGVADLGLYYVAQRIVQSVQTVLAQGINGVALPAFSEANGDIERVRRGYLFGIRLCATMTLPVFLSITLLADGLILELFGPEWHVSANILQLLAVGAAPGSALFLNQPLMVALGQSNRALRLAFLGTVATLPLLFLGSIWGVLGVSAAVALRPWMMLVAWFVIIRKALGLDLYSYLRELSPPLLNTAIMGVVIIAVRDLAGSGTAGMGAAIFAGGTCYIAIGSVINRDVFSLGADLVRRRMRKVDNIT